MGLLRPFEKTDAGDGSLRAIRTGLPDQDETARIAVWQRMQNDRIEDAEHRGVNADAEGQRQNGRDAEARLAGERT